MYVLCVCMLGTTAFYTYYTDTQRGSQTSADEQQDGGGGVLTSCETVEHKGMGHNHQAPRVCMCKLVNCVSVNLFECVYNVGLRTNKR